MFTGKFILPDLNVLPIAITNEGDSCGFPLLSARETKPFLGTKPAGAELLSFHNPES